MSDQESELSDEDRAAYHATAPSPQGTNWGTLPIPAEKPAPLPPEKMPPRIGQRWRYDGRLYLFDRIYTDGFYHFVDETGEPRPFDPIEWQRLTAAGAVTLVDRIEHRPQAPLEVSPTGYRDERRIDNPHDMPFAPEVADRMRALLAKCGCVVAADIAKLGCTGAMALTYDTEAGDPVQTTLDHAKFIRMGLAGTGAGLPCFVPLDRWCLVHETYGGLQRGQTQHYAEMIPSISRELTPQERVKVAMLLTATRTRGMYAAEDILLGIDEKKVAEIAREALGAVETMEPAKPSSPSVALPDVPFRERGWKCTDHATPNWKPNWNCRYCAAQMIVEGNLEPTYAMGAPGAVRLWDASGEALLMGIATCETADQIAVYVRVATFTRKLSRD